VDLIKAARKKGIRTLSEDDSRKVLETYGIPLVPSHRAEDLEQARQAASSLGFPVALKGMGSALAHKTESDVVRLNIKNEVELEQAWKDVKENAGDKLEAVLVQRMLHSEREFVAGMNRDPQFGPCVMFGLGGIFTEVLKDVVFRVAPLERRDALDMMEEIRGRKLLDAFRGQPAVDKEALVELLLGLGQVGIEHEDIEEIDVNPILIDGTKPVAVDALVVLKEK